MVETPKYFTLPRRGIELQFPDHMIRGCETDGSMLSGYSFSHNSRPFRVDILPTSSDQDKLRVYLGAFEKRDTGRLAPLGKQLIAMDELVEQLLNETVITGREIVEEDVFGFAGLYPRRYLLNGTTNQVADLKEIVKVVTDNSYW